MRHVRGVFATFLVVISTGAASPVVAAPEGQMTWAVHISLAPTWFDPAETSGIITPFLILYALHDAMVKPMPGNPMATSLAESWTTSPDGLVYEFVLRPGAKFHNGDQVTAEDVRFSFERYRGASFRGSSSSTGSLPAPRTIPRRPNSSSRKPATGTASTRATTSATPRSPASARPRSTT
jgi:ABC-type transport system substrate-binding protein